MLESLLRLRLTIRDIPPIPRPYSALERPERRPSSGVASSSTGSDI